MLPSCVQYANDLVVRVDIWLRAVPAANQTGRRNLCVWLDTAQVLSKPAYRGQVSSLRRRRAIAVQSKLNGKLRRNLARPLYFHKRKEAP
jgi:hypothetical protein